MIRSILIVGLFCMTFGFCKAKNTKDTLQNRISKFYKIAGIEHSEDRRLVSFKKIYGYNNDTMLVFDTHRSNAIIGTLIKKNSVFFMNNENILSFGNDGAEFWNVKTNVRKEYQNVKKIDLLKSLNFYFILKNDGTLTTYNVLGKEINTASKVQDFFINDKEKSLFIYYENGDLYKIADALSSKAVKLYSTNNEIDNIRLSPSGKQLMIVERDKTFFKKHVVFIDADTHNIVKPEGIIPEEMENFSIDEINDGEAYFIVGTRKINKPEVAEVWYGNDGNLEDTQFGYSLLQRHWLWKPGNESVYTLPSEKYSSIIPINNSRYFICFNSGALQNYLSSFSDVSVHIYDAKTNAIHDVGIASQSIMNVSHDGAYLTYFNTNKQWVLCNIETQKKIIVGDKNLNNPKFSFDNTLVFFESDNGLCSYDIKNKKLQSLNVGTGNTSTILNNNLSSSNFQSYIDKDAPVFVKITDKINNKSSYITWQRGRIKEVIAASSNNISEIVYNKNMELFWAIEENFNIPPRLVYLNNKNHMQQIIYKSNIHDEEAVSLKQEIIKYNNSDGIPLKGVLYYPENYNPSKEYPMVVHIYQSQSKKFNNYNIPEYSPIGFDLRTMLERGYFVYLPDTIVGSSGPGLSALDCVNKALDAVSTIKSIDINRIGLTGHSFGGYETDFIATHSSRFATYVSGAGHSDIVRAYFSYNYQFQKPYYFQFENGIYNMAAFAEDKELYAKNNPIHYVEKVNAPILLWAGKKDRNVPWEHSVEFYTGLKRNRKKVIALLYKNGDHSLTPNTDEAKDLHVRMLEWWDCFLKDKKDIDWINKQITEGAQ